MARIVRNRQTARSARNLFSMQFMVFAGSVFVLAACNGLGSANPDTRISQGVAASQPMLRAMSPDEYRHYCQAKWRTMSDAEFIACLDETQRRTDIARKEGRFDPGIAEPVIPKHFVGTPAQYRAMMMAFKTGPSVADFLVRAVAICKYVPFQAQDLEYLGARLEASEPPMFSMHPLTQREVSRIWLLILTGIEFRTTERFWDWYTFRRDRLVWDKDKLMFVERPAQ